MHPRIRIEAGAIDTAREAAQMAAGRTDIGALVTFTGICRDAGDGLAALEIEHYPGMAEEELGRIAAEAAGRWPLSELTIVHRHGHVVPGDIIVLVAAASRHRDAAFAATAFLMDYLKTRAPFWKREHWQNAGPGDWVLAKTSDAAAAAAWTREGGAATATKAETGAMTMRKHGTHAWSELATGDVAAAMRFYGKTLGWTFEEFPLGEGLYYIARSGDELVCGIGGLEIGALPGEVEPYWFHFIEVDDVDARIAAARRAGATIIREPADVPGVGRMAALRDPTGAPVGWMTGV